MRLEDLNWMDVEKYLEQEDRLILVTGATEQHGYLSLLTDIKIPLALTDAANIVFNSGVPIILVPLDATNHVPVTRRFYNALGKNLPTPSANLVYDTLTANLAFVDGGGFQFWDTLTFAVFTDESIAAFEEFQLTVVEQEGPESGYTKPGPDGPTIRVAVSADRNKFEQIFLTILNWEK